MRDIKDFNRSEGTVYTATLLESALLGESL